MLTSFQKDNLAAAVTAARACEAGTGLPAGLTAAQWVLESGWGAHAPGNNCFGIKQYPGCFDTQDLMTVEYEHGVRTTEPKTFAKFPSLEACFEYHARLITTEAPYAKAWHGYENTHDLSALIDGVAPVYATDPSYAHRLKTVLAMSEIQAALAAVHS